MHISQSQDNIIVFQKFDNVIEANIAKTKLDAYDVPCFLTDENFVSLYPIRNELFPGVRLCIFGKDEERAREVLKENNLLPSSSEETLRCAYCHSTHVIQDVSRKDWLSRVSAALMVSLFIPTKTVYTCEDCGRDFIMP